MPNAPSRLLALVDGKPHRLWRARRGEKIKGLRTQIRNAFRICTECLADAHEVLRGAFCHSKFSFDPRQEVAVNISPSSIFEI
jgi:hypothetical protein